VIEGHKGHTSRIAIRAQEHAIPAYEFLRVVNNLVEQTGKADRMTRRARTIHYRCGIRYVIFMIVGVDVLAVPARWEHEFEADAVFAMRIHVSFIGQEMAVQGAFGILRIVEAVESDGFLAEGGLRGLRRVAAPF
jgi:uncharacterized protein YqhQ